MVFLASLTIPMIYYFITEMAVNSVPGWYLKTLNLNKTDASTCSQEIQPSPHHEMTSIQILSSMDSVLILFTVINLKVENLAVRRFDSKSFTRHLNVVRLNCLGFKTEFTIIGEQRLGRFIIHGREIQPPSSSFRLVHIQHKFC